MLRNKNKLLILLFIGLLGIYVSLSVLFRFYNITPDENSRVFFLQKAAANQQYDFGYEEDSNAKYSTNLIHPRNSVISPANGSVVPSDFLGGNIYTLPLFAMLQSIPYWLLIFPVFALVGVIGVYRIAKFINNSRYSALLAALLVGLMPVYLYWSYRPMTDIPSLALILLGISFYIEKIYRNSESYKLAVLAGLFIGAGISIRYTNLLLVGAFFLIFVNYKKLLMNKRTLFFHLIMGVTLVCALLPILILNYKLYGNPLLTGQSIYSGSSTSITVRDVDIVGHLKNHFLSFFGILTILGGLGLAKHFSGGTQLGKKFTLWFILFFGLNLLLYGRADVFGSSAEKVLLNHSLARYYLGIYIMLIIGLSYYLAKYRRIGVYVIPLVLIVFVFQVLNYNGSGLLPYRQEIKRTIGVKNQILSSTGENSYVFTRLYDRLIFPERKVVTYFNSGIDSLDKRLENTAKLAHILKEDGQSVYFLRENIDPALARERQYETFEQNVTVFRKYSLGFRRVNGVVYEVVKK